MNFNEILKSDEKFRYQLLSRMKSDCDYYLGNGNRNAKHLWGEDEVKHIAYMKALWNSFGENDKPEWLTYEQILDYENKIGIKAILVEMDYKGYYERFALTPEEFEKEFPETFKNFGPIHEENSDTLRPMVHIWFEPCVVGDGAWERHFTDMEASLPESDIEAGNLAYIDYNQVQSLKKWVEPYVDKLELLHLSETRDFEYLKSRINQKGLQVIENVLEAYGKGEIDLVIPRTKGEIDFSNIDLKVIDNSYVETGLELLVLKWYEDFEDTGYLTDCFCDEGYDIKPGLDKQIESAVKREQDKQNDVSDTSRDVNSKDIER